jgi:hypothetical protein
MIKQGLPLLLSFASAAVVLAAAPREEALACGAFFAKASVPVERRPSLSVERVLILFDPEKEVEHFIREVTFRGSKETFGFVVPTPTKPDVFKVTESPFDRLERDFPYAPPPQSQRDGSNKGAPGAAAGGGGPPKVAILDIKKVGSFTAFVLAANDAAALAKWLKDNGLSSSPENDAWLQGYVEKKFYYVAFRYEPSKDQKDNGQPRAETIRISFKTPLAYYPYREPAHKSSTSERDVGLWVASPEPLVPVALTEEQGRPVWVKPFSEGMTKERVTGDRFKGVLGAEEDKLVSGAEYAIQPFEDQKVSRQRYGDVVFLPKRGVPEARRAAASAMLELLRPKTADKKVGQ